MKQVVNIKARMKENVHQYVSKVPDKLQFLAHAKEMHGEATEQGAEVSHHARKKARHSHIFGRYLPVCFFSSKYVPALCCCMYCACGVIMVYMQNTNCRTIGVDE